MWVQRTRCISAIKGMKQCIAYALPLRYNSEYFVNYQNITLEKPTDGLSIDNASWKIFGDGCVRTK